MLLLLLTLLQLWNVTSESEREALVEQLRDEKPASGSS